MKRLLIVGVALAFAVSGCSGSSPSVIATAPSALAALPAPTPPAPPAVSLSGTYSATLTASPSCASQLPAEATSRHFVVTLSDTGRLTWSAPTLFTPGGHAISSSGHVTEASFSLVIGTKEDPQSDAFHGIWERLSNEGWLTIAGEGSGMVEGGRISGSFSGMFHYYEAPQDGGPYRNDVYCTAADDTFTLIQQVAAANNSPAR